MEIIEMVTRHDLMAILGCSYSKACRTYNRIKKTISDQEIKPEHKSHLPKSVVQKYLYPEPKKPLLQ
jgi:hypothetical protein